MKKTLILIPSRMAATRLPGKPLLKINNLSIISHVFKRAEEANIGEVVVATEDQEILEDVLKNGGKAILTHSDHKTGTDRIFEAYKKLDIKNVDYILNLQGDEPDINKDDIINLNNFMINQDAEIGTLAAKIQDDKMFVGELLHTNNVNTPECNMETRDNYYPSTKLMGCAKESQTMKCYINMLETLISQDSTAESVFTGEIQLWLNEKVKRQGINIITSEYLGGRDNNGKLVTLDELMGSTFIEFHDSMLGIYIPDNELLLRSKYSWLSRMSSQQVLESNNVLGKYLVLASGISVSM